MKLPASPWWARIAEMVTATTCVVVVLLVLASNRTDGDEFTKGIPAGILGSLGAMLVSSLMRKAE